MGLGGRGHHFAMFVGAQWGMLLSSQGCVVPAPPASGPAAPAAAQRGRRHRHLDRALAADPPQGPDGPLRLRPAPALRDLGGEALRRQPRQGARAVPRAPSRACSTASITDPTGASRAACQPSCSRACSTSWTARKPDAHARERHLGRRPRCPSSRSGPGKEGREAGRLTQTTGGQADVPRPISDLWKNDCRRPLQLEQIRNFCSTPPANRGMFPLRSGR